MSYDTALTSYSLLPKKAFPLDARSHFEDFETARLDILDRVCAAEDSFESRNYDKLYYIGEIITTTYNGTWQVGNKVLVSLYIYCERLNTNSFKIAWNKQSSNDYVNFYLETTRHKDDNNNSKILIDIYSYNGGPKIGSVDIDISSVFSGEWLSQVCNIETNIVPFSGGGGSSSSAGQLVIDAQAPLNYNTTNNQLTLSIDSGSPLYVKDNQLTLSIDSNSPLGVTSNNELTINIDTNSKLKVVNNKLTVDIQGTHTTLKKNDTTTNIDINNYIYQEL